jgi:hypothetical protein
MKQPNWLLIAIAIMVFEHLTYEQRIGAGVLFGVLVVLFWLLWLVAVYPDRRRTKKEMRKRAIFHYEAYQRFKAEQEEIAGRYKLSPVTAITAACREELDELNLKYKETLDYRESSNSYNDANGIILPQE